MINKKLTTTDKLMRLKPDVHKKLKSIALYRDLTLNKTIDLLIEFYIENNMNDVYDIWNEKR